MWVSMNERYRLEKERYNLKECCEDCRHFFNDSQCAMLYPVKPHRRESFEMAKDGERIYFCKMFEVDDA